MARRSIADRLDAYADELLAEPGDTPRPPAAPGAPGRYDGPLPTSTHVALVELLDRILELGQRYSTGPDSDGAGVMLKTAMRTVRRLRPYMLEQLAKVPEDELRAFMATLVGEISAAIGATPPAAPTSDHDDEGDDGSRPDQSQSEAAGAARGWDPGRQVNAG